jgi:uncharacterized protein with PIN domain/sulfur carrier protein ThiS
MAKATIRFYADLNFFLPQNRRQVAFTLPFAAHQSVKDLIESLGVPHTEVELILVNGEPVDFSALLNDGDRISVYPTFEALDVTPLLRARFDAQHRPGFVLDQHLGRLAAYLRALGFDTLYRNDYDDPELAETSDLEERILLTRDLGLLKRRRVTHGYYVRSTDPRQQVSEVVRRFDLYHLIEPFRRCVHCNAPLESVDKADVADQLEPRTLEYYDEFQRCTGCGRVYWKGSHTVHMQQIIDDLLREGLAE